jgi:hypothetical protein
MLAKLAVGDIFHAESPNGASMVCLVVSVTESAIHARRVPTQTDLLLDRRTGVGVEKFGGEQAPCIINSVAPLPAEIHNVFLEMDRKYRLDTDTERFKLTDAEKRAYRFIDSHYPSNPLPALTDSPEARLSGARESRPRGHKD